MSTNELIVKKFNNGEKITNIARELKVSRQHVYNILNNNKIQYKKAKNNIDVNEIKQSLNYDTIKGIMDKNEISYYEMNKIMKENNLTKKSIMNGRLSVNNVKRLYQEVGLNDKEIGRLFNCSEYTVRSFRWNNNIYNKNRNWKNTLTKDVFYKLRSEGKSLKEISEVVQLPYYLVLKAKNEYETKKKNS